MFANTQVSVSQDITSGHMSLKELQRNAKTEKEVGLWLTGRAAARQKNPYARWARVEISASYLMGVFFAKDPSECLLLYLTVPHYDEDNPYSEVFESIGARFCYKQIGMNEDHWALDIRLEDWSFLVAHVAVRYVNTSVWEGYAPEQQKRAYTFLKKHLPEHFPGLTPEILRKLYKTGIMEEKPFDQMQDDLMSMRGCFGVDTKGLAVTLPDTLDIGGYGDTQ